MMQFDFIIIGSGIAGLNFALNAVKKGRVLVITKKAVALSSTNYAQGGVAAVLDKMDSFGKHVADTLKAGAYHNNRRTVEFVVRHAPRAIRRLIRMGVDFDNTAGRLDLRLEGGHSVNRIAHVGDYTGLAIEEVLVKKAQANKKISIWEDAFALDLLVRKDVCYGVRIVREERIENIFGGQTILATGGVGQLYKFTSNPEISTGDGIAMADRAGLECRDLEFVQFHPTAFFHKGRAISLLSETLRGEGAFLCHKDGKPFMRNYDVSGDLAPRDIVTRAVFKEMKKGPVFLRFHTAVSAHLKRTFPHIFRELKKYGFDLGKDFIPIVPVAHFLCGGVRVDSVGKTSIRNLFAFGEVSCTGMHGANRLGSNGLLEALVFSGEIAGRLKKVTLDWKSLEEEFPIRTCFLAGKRDFGDLRRKIQNIMWEEVGIVRSPGGMKAGLDALMKIKKDLEAEMARGVSEKLAITYNMASVAVLIARAGLKRRKSLGGHFIDSRRGV